MVDHIIFSMLRLRLHAPDNVAQSRSHVGDDDRAMPIGFRTDRHFVEEDVAQKMVSVQNDAGTPNSSTKITHFLPEASSCRRNTSLGVRSNAGNTGHPPTIGRRMMLRACHTPADRSPRECDIHNLPRWDILTLRLHG